MSPSEFHNSPSKRDLCLVDFSRQTSSHNLFTCCLLGFHTNLFLRLLLHWPVEHYLTGSDICLVRKVCTGWKRFGQKTQEYLGLTNEMLLTLRHLRAYLSKKCGGLGLQAPIEEISDGFLFYEESPWQLYCCEGENPLAEQFQSRVDSWVLGDSKVKKVFQKSLLQLCRSCVHNAQLPGRNSVGCT